MSKAMMTLDILPLSQGFEKWSPAGKPVVPQNHAHLRPKGSSRQALQHAGVVSCVGG
jgi:hypothetical protein